MGLRMFGLMLLCVGGLSVWLHANPVQTAQPAMSSARSQGLLGVLDAGGTSLLWQENDNITGLQVGVFEHSTGWLVLLEPFSPHPERVGHMTEPLVPDVAVVRHRSWLQVREYPLQRVGERWLTFIPAGTAPRLPGDRFELLVWDADADATRDDEAGFDVFLEIL